jgi:hypothetical protein
MRGMSTRGKSFLWRLTIKAEEGRCGVFVPSADLRLRWTLCRTGCRLNTFKSYL